MGYSLSDFITELRQRFEVPKMHNGSAVALGSLSDNAMARYANEAHLTLVREVVKVGGGPYVTHNKGWFLRYAWLTIQSDGRAVLPLDVEQLIGVTTTEPKPSEMEFEPVQLLGGRCPGQWMREGNLIRFDPSLAGSTRYVVYQSNLKGLWTAGTVSSGTTSTFVASATPSYSTAPISQVDDAYNGLVIEVVSGGVAQTATVKDYEASTRTFTIYGTWPSFTPASSDTWSLHNALPFDEFLLYETAMRVAPSERRKDYYPMYNRLKDEVHWSVNQRHGWER